MLESSKDSLRKMLSKNGSEPEHILYSETSVVRHARLDPLVRAGPCSRKRYADVGMNTARPCGLVVSKRKLILIYREKEEEGKMEKRTISERQCLHPSLARVTGKEEEEGGGAADKNI